MTNDDVNLETHFSRRRDMTLTSTLKTSSAIVALAVVVVLGLSVARAQESSVSEVQKGRCPSGYTLQTNNTPRYAYCAQTTNQQVQQFSNPAYNPCVPPGQYVSSDEVPNGANEGRDRCTVPTGIGTGPALPCPPSHPNVNIREGQRDRCYRMVTQQVTQYVNLQLYE
jgi:hypothetical protein